MLKGYEKLSDGCETSIYACADTSKFSIAVSWTVSSGRYKQTHKNFTSYSATHYGTQGASHQHCLMTGSQLARRQCGTMKQRLLAWLHRTLQCPGLQPPASSRP